MSASKFNNVQWGWRIQCCNPNCDHEYTQYHPPHLTESEQKGWSQRTGPPSLASVTEMKEAGWYCKWQREGAPTYFALCPEHAAPGIAWSKAMDEWDESRRTAGKAVAEREASLMERLTAWFDKKILGRKVAPFMEQWKDQNPRPTPPWEQDTDSHSFNTPTGS
jgi:hypothetical protein